MWLGTARQQYFSGRTVLLLHRTNLQEFWYHDLHPWVHYAPLNRDFSDLVERVRLLNRQPALAARIAANAAAYGAQRLRAMHGLLIPRQSGHGYAEMTSTQQPSTAPECATVVRVLPEGEQSWWARCAADTSPHTHVYQLGLCFLKCTWMRHVRFA